MIRTGKMKLWVQWGIQRWMFWGRFAYNLGKFNLLHHLCSSCNKQRDTTNSPCMYNLTWIECLILQWNILYPTCMSQGQCGYNNYVMCKAMWNCGKQRQRWCQRKQNIHSGLVWMHVYLLQSTCCSGLEWKFNCTTIHLNICGLRWIHVHPNKASSANWVKLIPDNTPMS